MMHTYRPQKLTNRVAFAAVLLLLSLNVAALAQRDLAIAAIQGDKDLSPYDGQAVRITGVVTARIRTGFFVQTPDDKADADPNTSEGIFVFTRTDPPTEALIGNLVSVTGRVEEFRRNNEPNSLTITELAFQADRDQVRVISTGYELPKPIVLKTDDFKPNTIDQLERFEGMRVQANELIVISPTDGQVDVKNTRSESNGTFYGVLKGIKRPFREPGLEIAEYLFIDEKARAKFKSEFPKLPFFDMNPERLRIESSSQTGARPINVTVSTELSGITGVMHYAFRTNTLIVDADNRPKLSGTIKPNPLPVPKPGQFSVAGMNIENFFDDQDDPAFREDVVAPEAFQRRLNKISIAIRDVMKQPDVIGIVEAEGIYAISKLAEKINADSVAAGLPDPKYAAYLFEGIDGRGIDNGFLVKTSRVTILDNKQFGKAEKYKHPGTGEEVFLNDRPPHMLTVAINDAAQRPFQFTIVVNHMKSYSGYNDPRQQDNVRLKKKLQAEFLAKWVNERQRAGEKVILVGDFNSYEFSDGILDMIGTIKGAPAAKDAVFNASPDMVEPDLINLVDLIDVKQRYSYTFDGNAQTLDHILITQSLRSHVNGFGFARVNADFPEAFRADGLRPERFSDHDPAVVYFSFQGTAGK